MNSVPLTQAELDRLVDDECDEATRRSLLLRVAAANCWEQLALTFLEDQALRRAVRALCTEAPHGAASQSRSTTDFQSAEQCDAQDVRRTKLRVTRRLYVTTIAAAVLIVIACGNFMLGPRDTNRRVVDWLFRGMPTAPEYHIVEDKNLTVTTTSDDALPSSVKFVVNDGQGDMPRVFDVPIQSNATAIDITQWQPQSVLSDETRDWLASSGHEVEEAASLVPVTLPNGRNVAFPVHQVRVNYRGPQWHQ